MYADYHVHTEFSDDSVYPLEDVIQDAIRMNMDEIYITDHVDYPLFDFIILSIHQVEDKEFWTQDFQQGKTQEKYNKRYYEEMLNVVKKYKNYSVLGHMDLITRYDKNGVYPFERIKQFVEEILKIVIKDGKGIELNTSYHRYGLEDTTPSAEILKLYRELGGSIITIGSDSHKPEHLAVLYGNLQRMKV